MSCLRYSPYPLFISGFESSKSCSLSIQPLFQAISSGQDIIASIALKPTSSITTPGKTVDSKGAETEIIVKGRHDPCVGVRAAPIAEAMVAIVLMDHLLRHRGQNADVQKGE